MHLLIIKTLEVKILKTIVKIVNILNQSNKIIYQSIRENKRLLSLIITIIIKTEIFTAKTKIIELIIM